MGKGKKNVILLVEDNDMDIMLMLDAFVEAGVKNDTRIAKSGEQALDYLLGHGEFADRSLHPLPDIILLDINLPGISGIDVLKTLKQTDILKRIPVVILTSSAEEKDRIAGYDNGANSFLVKPTSFSNLVDVAGTLDKYWCTYNEKASLRPLAESNGFLGTRLED